MNFKRELHIPDDLRIAKNAVRLKPRNSSFNRSADPDEIRPAIMKSLVNLWAMPVSKLCKETAAEVFVTVLENVTNIGDTQGWRAVDSRELQNTKRVKHPLHNSKMYYQDARVYIWCKTPCRAVVYMNFWEIDIILQILCASQMKHRQRFYIDINKAFDSKNYQLLLDFWVPVT